MRGVPVIVLEVRRHTDNELAPVAVVEGEKWKETLGIEMEVDHCSRHMGDHRMWAAVVGSLKLQVGIRSRGEL